MVEIGDTLLISQTVRCGTEKYGAKAKIIKHLGDGKQGIIFEVETDAGRFAAKWYNPEFQTEDLRNNIMHLILKRDDFKINERFVWPLALLSAENEPNQFGYLMKFIDTHEYLEIGQLLWDENHKSELKCLLDAKKACLLSYYIADSFDILHNAGCSYKDINNGNVLFKVNEDIRKCDIAICDTDNITFDGDVHVAIKGTWEYMAPEVARDEEQPSIYSDLFSLAVILFRVWCLNHPFHGKVEYELGGLTTDAEREEFYKNLPAFIFDRDDASNHLPVDDNGEIVPMGLYAIANTLWFKHCPPELRSLFREVFVENRDCPMWRPKTSDWKLLFAKMQCQCITCLECGDTGVWCENGSCLDCNTPYDMRNEQYLIINPYEDFSLPILPGENIIQKHLDIKEFCYSNERNEKYWNRPIAKFSVSASGEYSLRNLSPENLSIYSSDGEELFASVREGESFIFPNMPVLIWINGTKLRAHLSSIIEKPPVTKLYVGGKSYTMNDLITDFSEKTYEWKARESVLILRNYAGSKIEATGNLLIYLENGTENSINNCQSDYFIEIEGSLRIIGSGLLEIYCAEKYGICITDELTIENGIIETTGMEGGVKANSVDVRRGTLRAFAKGSDTQFGGIVCKNLKSNNNRVGAHDDRYKVKTVDRYRHEKVVWITSDDILEFPGDEEIIIMKGT